MKFLAIDIDESKNSIFVNNPDCELLLSVYPEFYKKVGFVKPWIGYFIADDNDEIIAFGGFKGKPRNGKIEIAYGTVPKYERQGIGSRLCKELVLIALNEDRLVKITARTLPEENTSNRILKRNGFEFLGLVWDEEDGEVWEWEFKNTDVSPAQF